MQSRENGHVRRERAGHSVAGAESVPEGGTGRWSLPCAPMWRPGTCGCPSRRRGGGWASGRYRSGRARGIPPGRDWRRRCRYGCRCRRPDARRRSPAAASACGCRAGWSSRSAGLPRRRCGSATVGAQSRQLVGKAQQRVDRVADQVGGGLVAGVKRKMQFCTSSSADSARRRPRRGSARPARPRRRPAACAARPPASRGRSRTRTASCPDRSRSGGTVGSSAPRIASE